MFNLKKLPIIIALSLTPQLSHAAFPESEMNEIFGAMINITDPATVEASAKNAQRGYIGGGQIYMTLPRKNVDIISAVAPSVTMGCGGINLFGGSLSALSSDEIVATFQAIGANALYYGVKLAITNACNVCEQVMTSLEKTAQLLNQMNLDSCKAAEGIVTKFAEGGATNVMAATQNIASGYVDDFSEIWSQSGSEGKTPEKVLSENSPDKHKELVTGNFVWRALKRNEDKLTRAFGSADDPKILEAFLTITGSQIVIHDTINDENKPISKPLAGYKLTIKDFLDGGTFNIYKCDTKDTENGCLNPIITNSYKITIPSMTKKTLDGFLDVINAYNNDVGWTENAKNITTIRSNRGQMCLKQFKDMSVASKGNDLFSKGIAENCAQIATLEAVHHIFNEVLYVTEKAIQSLDNEQQKSAFKAIDKTRKAFNLEYSNLIKTINNNYMIDEVDVFIKSALKQQN